MVPGVIGEESERDLAALVVARVGRLEETGSPWEPYRLVDPSGGVVRPVGRFLRELQALGRSEATQRSYGHDLLRWFRPINCTMSLIFSQADRLVCQRSMVWSRMYDVP